MLSLLSRCRATATRQLLRLCMCLCQWNVQVQVQVELKWIWPRTASRPTLRCNKTKSDHNHVNLTERERESERERAVRSSRPGEDTLAWLAILCIALVFVVVVCLVAQQHRRREWKSVHSVSLSTAHSSVSRTHKQLTCGEPSASGSILIDWASEDERKKDISAQLYST